jgi:hypothetical protein
MCNVADRRANAELHKRSSLCMHMHICHSAPLHNVVDEALYKNYPAILILTHYCTI